MTFLLLFFSSPTRSHESSQVVLLQRVIRGDIQSLKEGVATTGQYKVDKQDGLAV